MCVYVKKPSPAFQENNIDNSYICCPFHCIVYAVPPIEMSDHSLVGLTLFVMIML